MSWAQAATMAGLGGGQGEAVDAVGGVPRQPRRVELVAGGGGPHSDAAVVRPRHHAAGVGGPEDVADGDGGVPQRQRPPPRGVEGGILRGAHRHRRGRRRVRRELDVHDGPPPAAAGADAAQGGQAAPPRLLRVLAGAPVARCVHLPPHQPAEARPLHLWGHRHCFADAESRRIDGLPFDDLRLLR